MVSRLNNYVFRIEICVLRQARTQGGSLGANEPPFENLSQLQND